MVLHYRIPGQETVTCQGQFHPLQHNDKPNGFIVSTANGEKRYAFKPSASVPFGVESQYPPHQSNEHEYLAAVHQITNAIAHSDLKKVVYSRVSKRGLGALRRLQYFNRLIQAYPNAFVYYFEDENLGAWIGATPEILLRRIENHCFIMSLAGTKKSAEARDWTEKERIEQALVTDFILNGVRAINSEHIEIEGPYDHPAGPVEHLRTDISFSLDPARESELIRMIHPTPAVCGLPREMARTAYELLELHTRELYTGYIGLFNEEQTHCYVNLRCAKLIDDEIFAFVGGGITEESIPELEWKETENKSKTLFDLL
ncbi:MAG: chorismate-binding protein [Cryomorphaceae bacterium]|jgi:isochorismate synthase|nr:chorismate-binding protein [Cryomorphaceae bacterium]